MKYDALKEKLDNPPWSDCSCHLTMGEAAQAITDLEAEIARLRDVLENIMVGGNHLALLIGANHPPYTAESEDALRHYGAGDTYEIWCCWRSIMQARQALEGE